MTLTFGTFCSGIGAPEKAWTNLGWRSAFCSEIEPFPCAVLAHHFPETPNLGDMTRIDPKLLPDVDIWAAGTPCQDFSVAGKRAGFAGARGLLTYCFIELLRGKRPSWFVFENVPGILSGDCAAGFAAFLDELEALGYVLDVDILDAQFCGVPQRRRRVFVCGQHVGSLLKQKTPSSALTIAQCLTESLALAFSVLSGRLLIGSEGLDFDVTNAARSLQRRMRLFGMDRDEAARTLRESLDVLPPSSGCVPDAWASRHGRNSTGGLKSTGATRSKGSSKATVNSVGASPSIAASWNEVWAEAFSILNECITSTPSSETIESKIYTCSLLTLNITERIIRSPDSSPCYLNSVSSGLIALAEFTNYARTATESLFANMEWVQPWGDFLAQAERLYQSFGCPGDWQCPDSLFSFIKSLFGNPPPNREAGARIADRLTNGTGGGGRGYDLRNGVETGVVAGTLQAKKTGYSLNAAPAVGIPIPIDMRQASRGATMTNNRAADACSGGAPGTGIGEPGDPSPAISLSHPPAIAYQCHGTNVGEMGTLRKGNGNVTGGVPFISQPIPISSDAANGRTGDAETPSADAEGRVRLRPPSLGVGEQGDPSFAVSAQGIPAIAFQERGREGGRSVETQADLAYSLNAPAGGGRRHEMNVAVPITDLPNEDRKVQQVRSVTTDRRQAGSCGNIGGAGVGTSVLELCATEVPDDEAVPAVAFQTRIARNGRGQPEAVCPTLQGAGAGATSDMRPCVVTPTMAVRRLMPIECERLMSFPDGWTAILFNGKPAADGPRYRALGNSMVQKELQWIGRRIMEVDRVSPPLLSAAQSPEVAR